MVMQMQQLLVVRRAGAVHIVRPATSSVQARILTVAKLAEAELETARTCLAGTQA
jgi:hypothetical protein